MDPVSTLVLTPIAINLFSGFLQQYIVDQRDKIQDRIDKNQNDLVNARSLVNRVSGQIAGKLRDSNLTDADLAPIEKVLSDDVAVKEIVCLLIDGRLNPDDLAEKVRLYDAGITPEKASSLCVFFVDSFNLAIASDNTTAHAVTHSRLAEQGDALREGVELLRSFQGSIENLENADLSSKLDRILKGQQEMAASIANLQQPVSSQQPSLSAGAGSIMPSPEVAPVDALNKKRFDRARDELEKGYIPDAERDFAGLVEDLKSSSANQELLFRSLSNLGICRLRRGKREEAAKFWEEAFLLKPDLQKAKTNRALGLVFEKRFGDAEAMLDDVIGHDPNCWDAIAIRAALFAESHRSQEGVKFLSEHFVDRAEYHVLLAQQLMHLKKYDEALASADRALSLDSNSSAALAVKASALAVPVIYRNSDMSSPYFTLTESGRKQLAEGVSLLGLAIAAFKTRGETSDLGVYLANLSAYYAALGNFHKSGATALEAISEFGGEDGAICNLFYAQMQLNDFASAAKTATLLCDRGNIKEGAARLLDALVWDRSFARALEEFDSAAQKLPGLKDDVYACCLRARALFGLPKTDEAVSYIDSVISKFPEDSLPLLQKADFEEQLNRPESAGEYYKKAQALVEGESKLMIRQQEGIFLFRTKSWDAALERIFPAGLEPLYSPFLREGLICLYKLGQFRECLNLARRAIAKDGYDEMTYSLAAHCYAHFRQLPDAIAHFKELVARADNFSYWIALAQLYFRTDNLAEAEGLLQRAHEAHPTNPDIIFLLSGLKARGGKDEEAMELAIRGRKLAPDSIAANQALIVAGLNLSPKAQVKPEHTKIFAESMAFLTQHPESGVRQIPASGDMAEIKKMLKKRRKDGYRALNAYSANALPQGALARALGKSPFEIWNYLISSPEQTVWVADGSPEEQKSKFGVLDGLDEITLDVTCLFTFQLLGLLEVLPKLFGKIHTPVAVFESIKIEGECMDAAKLSGTTMALEGGRIAVRETSPEIQAKNSEFIAGILRFLKTLSAPEGVLETVAESEAAKKWLPAFTPTHIDSVLVAAGHGCPLALDDLGLQKLAMAEFKAPCVSTQYILISALTKGLITPDQYHSAGIKMLERGYNFISDSAETVVKELDSHGYEITPLAHKLLTRLSDVRINLPAATDVLLEVIAKVWVNQPERGKRARVIEVCAKNFAQDRVMSAVLMPFCSKLLVRFIDQPSIYFGIAIQIFTDKALSYEQRQMGLRLVLVAASAAAKEFGKREWSASLRNEWILQRRAARQLIKILRQGV